MRGRRRAKENRTAACEAHPLGQEVTQIGGSVPIDAFTKLIWAGCSYYANSFQLASFLPYPGEQSDD